MTLSTEKRDRPEACEIEVTPEMVEAGVGDLLECTSDYGFMEGEAIHLAVRIYGAMVNCRAGAEIVPESLSYMRRGERLVPHGG